MIEDPELYGLIWEDYLIMTENIEELLLETEYDVLDLEKAANELADLWESFDVELLAAEKPDVEEEKKQKNPNPQSKKSPINNTSSEQQKTEKIKQDL